MDARLIWKEKCVAEEAIAAIIRKFQKRTGLLVHGVNFIPVNTITGNVAYTCVKIDARIE